MEGRTMDRVSWGLLESHYSHCPGFSWEGISVPGQRDMSRSSVSIFLIDQGLHIYIYIMVCCVLGLKQVDK